MSNKNDRDELHDRALNKTRADIKHVFKEEYRPAIYEALSMLQNNFITARAQEDEKTKAV